MNQRQSVSKRDQRKDLLMKRKATGIERPSIFENVIPGSLQSKRHTTGEIREALRPWRLGQDGQREHSRSTSALSAVKDNELPEPFQQRASAPTTTTLTMVPAHKSIIEERPWRR